MREWMNRLRNWLNFGLRHRFVQYGKHVHVKWNVKIFAPHKVVRFGDHVGIGDYSTINTDVVLGNYVMLAANVGLIARDAHTTDMVGLTMWESPRADAQMIVIEDDVWIGYGAIILSGVRIGRGAIVGAGAVVVKDVPPYSIVASQPARILRQRFTPEQIERHEELLLNRTTAC